MTPGSIHYAFTLFDMAAKGYVNPQHWRTSEGDRLFAYRNFDSCFDHELGLVIDLAAIQKLAGADQADFVEKALPSFVWLMKRYIDKYPDLYGGRIILIRGDERLTIEELYPRYADQFKQEPTTTEQSA